MKVFVVIGYNGLLKASGPVGVATSQERAEKIAEEHKDMLDSVLITELELEEAKAP